MSNPDQIHEIIAGALFDFAGFLTSLPKERAVTFSGSHNASPAVTLLTEWAKKRGLQLDEAQVSGWASALVAPTEAAAMAATVPAVAKFMGRRLTPEGTSEFWGVLLCDPKDDPAEGTLLHMAAQAPVADQPAEPSPADSALGQHALNELLELGYTVVNGDLHPPEEGLGKLHCGHPASLMLKSAETGNPLYCELCNAMSARNDAEAMERELRQKLASAIPVVEKLLEGLRYEMFTPCEQYDDARAKKLMNIGVDAGEKWLAAPKGDSNG